MVAINATHPIITRVVVRSGWAVDYLQTTYQLSNGLTKTIEHGAVTGGIEHVDIKGLLVNVLKDAST